MCILMATCWAGCSNDETEPVDTPEELPGLYQDVSLNASPDDMKDCVFHVQLVEINNDFDKPVAVAEVKSWEPKTIQSDYYSYFFSTRRMYKPFIYFYLDQLETTEYEVGMSFNVKILQFVIEQRKMLYIPEDLGICICKIKRV